MRKAACFILCALCTSTAWSQSDPSGPAKPHTWNMTGAPYPLAQQDAWVPSVTLYGRVNIDLTQGSSNTSSGMGLLRVNPNGSRLGVEGKESLGGGLNTIFRIESAIANDAGGGQIAGREAWVGLQGDWGAVKLGKTWTAYDDLYTAGIFSDNVGRNGTVSSTSIWGNSGVFTTDAGAISATTLNNGVRYELPDINGLKGALQYNTYENENHSYIVSSSLLYKNRGFNSGIVYTYNKGVRTPDFDDQAFSVAASYTFDFAKFSALYERLEYDVQGGQLTRNLFGAGTTIPLFSKSSLWLWYVMCPDAKGPAGTKVGDVHAGDETRVSQFSIAFNYPFSKRTSVYAGYVYIDNGDNSNYTFWRSAQRVVGQAGNSLSENGLAQQGITIGMNHAF